MLYKLYRKLFHRKQPIGDKTEAMYRRSIAMGKQLAKISELALVGIKPGPLKGTSKGINKLRQRISEEEGRYVTKNEALDIIKKRIQPTIF